MFVANFVVGLGLLRGRALRHCFRAGIDFQLLQALHRVIYRSTFTVHFAMMRYHNVYLRI